MIKQIALISLLLMSSELSAEMRSWTSSGGKYKVDATLIAIESNSVKLRKADGTTIDVPLEKLSVDDQKYVRQLNAMLSGKGVLPEEYRILATHLAEDMKPSPNDFDKNKLGINDVILEGHSAVMALRGIKSADTDIAYIAEQGQSAISDGVSHFEKLIALPRPPGAEEVFAESFIAGFFGDSFGVYATAVDVNDKQNAIVAELYPLCAAIEKTDAAQQLLPNVAKKYSAPISDSADRMSIQYYDAWGPFGPYDWLCIWNGGPEIDDATVVVKLTNANGTQRQNVHYVQRWPTKTSMYARYGQGTVLIDRPIGRTSIENVAKIEATIYSPKYATTIKYVYEKAEKDRHIAERCKNLNITAKYQTFVPGAIWDTQRGIFLTLNGIEFLPQCRVSVGFHGQNQVISWHWDLDQWKKEEEKEFTPTKGSLTFDPETIEVVISFPGTNYTVNRTFQTNK